MSARAFDRLPRAGTTPGAVRRPWRWSARHRSRSAPRQRPAKLHPIPAQQRPPAQNREPDIGQQQQGRRRHRAPRGAGPPAEPARPSSSAAKGDPARPSTDKTVLWSQRHGGAARPYKTRQHEDHQQRGRQQHKPALTKRKVSRSIVSSGMPWPRSTGRMRSSGDPSTRRGPPPHRTDHRTRCPAPSAPAATPNCGQAGGPGNSCASSTRPPAATVSGCGSCG